MTRNAICVSDAEFEVVFMSLPKVLSELLHAVPGRADTEPPRNTAAEQASDASFPDIFALWSKYEDVAMHFNELIASLQPLALG